MHRASLLVLAMVVGWSPRALADDKKACIDASEEGQKLRKDGKLSEAKQKFLVCAAASCPTVVSSDCSTWIGELDSTFPSIVVVVRDTAGDDVPSATLRIDGGAAQTLDGKAIQLDPGKHVLEVTANDTTVKVDVMAVTNEKNRVVNVKVPKKAASTPEPAPPSSGRSPLPFILGGVGIVGVGVGAFLGYSALSKRNELRDTCAPKCARADIDGVEHKRLATDIVLGLSIVSLGVATFLFLRSDEPSDAKKPAVGVVVAPSFAALDLRLTF